MNLCYTNHLDPNTQQIRIAAQFAQKSINCIQITSPITLQTNDGILTQPNTVIRYLAKQSNLEVTNKALVSQVNQWFEYFNIQIYPIIKQINNCIITQSKVKRQKYLFCINQLQRILKIIDDHLKLRTVFVGNSITVVDLLYCTHLDNIFKFLLTEQKRKKYNNLLRWYTFVRKTSPFIKVLGDIVLCERQLDPTFQQPQEQCDFDLDMFKCDFIQKTQKYQKKKLLKNLINELKNSQWNFWQIQYQHLQMQGKSQKMMKLVVDSSLQIIEPLKDRAFGNMGVYNNNGNYSIRGIMIWEGQEIVPEWLNHPTYQYHKIKKIENIDEKVLQQYWLDSPSAESIPMVYNKRII